MSVDGLTFAKRLHSPRPLCTRRTCSFMCTVRLVPLWQMPYQTPSCYPFPSHTHKKLSVLVALSYYFNSQPHSPHLFKCAEAHFHLISEPSLSPSLAHSFRDRVGGGRGKYSTTSRKEREEDICAPSGKGGHGEVWGAACACFELKHGH